MNLKEEGNEMIGNKKILSIIPARGGSKSIKKKNIVEICGKPLIAWTIETAFKTVEIDKVVVSTDDIEIASIAKEYGADVQMRPLSLATDTSLVIDTIKYVINTLKDCSEHYDYVVLLEPTSPFRSVDDISECINLIYSKSLDSVATFKEADLNPHRAWEIDDSSPRTFIKGAIPWLPRQELPKAYQLNGAVYVTDVDKILKSQREIILGEIGSIIMPKERSIDIDEPIDLIIAELLMKKIKKEE